MTIWIWFGWLQLHSSTSSSSSITEGILLGWILVCGNDIIYLFIYISYYISILLSLFFSSSPSFLLSSSSLSLSLTLSDDDFRGMIIRVLYKVFDDRQDTIRVIALHTISILFSDIQVNYINHTISDDETFSLFIDDNNEIVRVWWMLLLFIHLFIYLFISFFISFSIYLSSSSIPPIPHLLPPFLTSIIHPLPPSPLSQNATMDVISVIIQRIDKDYIDRFMRFFDVVWFPYLFLFNSPLIPSLLFL